MTTSSPTPSGSSPVSRRILLDVTSTDPATSKLSLGQAPIYTIEGHSDEYDVVMEFCGPSIRMTPEQIQSLMEFLGHPEMQGMVSRWKR